MGTNIVLLVSYTSKTNKQTYRGKKNVFTRGRGWVEVNWMMMDKRYKFPVTR